MASPKDDEGAKDGGLQQPSFLYLKTSPYAASYARPSPFQDLELLLPASLWSPSFVEQRSHYTLLPRTAPLPHEVNPATSRSESPTSSTPLVVVGISGDSVGAAGEHTSLSVKRVRASLSSASSLAPAPATSLSRAEIVAGKTSAAARREEASVGGGQGSPHRRWSLIEMQRSLIQARYPNGIGFAAASSPRAAAAAVRSGGADTVTTPSRSSAAKQSAPPSSPDEVVSDVSLVLVASDDDSEEEMPSDGCRKVERALFPQKERDDGEGGKAASGDDVDALLAALDVIESLLFQVSELHYTECPLCSPVLAPSWFAHGSKQRKRSRYGPPPPPTPSPREGFEMKNATETDSQAEHTAAAAVSPLSPSPSSSSTCLLLPSEGRQRRVHILARAHAFLAFHKERVDYLYSTRPVMYASSAEHELVRQCKELGGIALLEALLIMF